MHACDPQLQELPRLPHQQMSLARGLHVKLKVWGGTQVASNAWVVADTAAQLHLITLAELSHAGSRVTCQQLEAPLPVGQSLPLASVLCFRPDPSSRPGAHSGPQAPVVDMGLSWAIADQRTACTQAAAVFSRVPCKIRSFMACCLKRQLMLQLISPFSGVIPCNCLPSSACMGRSAGEPRGLVFLGTEGGNNLFLGLSANASQPPSLTLVAHLDSLAPIHSAFAFEDPPGTAPACKQQRGLQMACVVGLSGSGAIQLLMGSSGCLSLPDGSFDTVAICTALRAETAEASL